MLVQIIIINRLANFTELVTINNYEFVHENFELSKQLCQIEYSRAMNFPDGGSEGIERNKEVSSDVGKTPSCTLENVSKLTPHKYRQTYRVEWESMPDFKGWDTKYFTK